MYYAIITKQYKNMDNLSTVKPNGKKVLITEDDKLFRDLLVRKLTGSGFEVVATVNAESALKALETFAPDLAVLDILLPGANGFDLLSSIRNKETTKNLPVIFLSNLSSKEDFQKGKDLGIAAFLVKAAVTPNEVVSEVNRVLGL